MRTANIILSLVAAILVALCLHQRSQIRAVRGAMIELRKQPVVAPDTMQAAPIPEIAAALPAGATGTLAAAVAGEEKKITIKKRPYEELIRMLKDPNRKRFMEAKWTLEMDSMYGPLFRYYEMTPEELRYLQSMLVENWSLAEDSTVRRLEAGADRDEQAAAVKEQQRVERDFDARMREFLGGDAYDEYDGYCKSLPERMTLADFKRLLENTGRPLSYSQEDALIRLMYEERQSKPGLRRFMQGTEVASTMEPKKAGSILYEFDVAHARVLARANGILDADQFGSFTNYVGQLRDGLRVSLSVQSAVRSTY